MLELTIYGISALLAVSAIMILYYHGIPIIEILFVIFLLACSNYVFRLRK